MRVKVQEYNGQQGPGIICMSDGWYRENSERLTHGPKDLIPNTRGQACDFAILERAIQPEAPLADPTP